MNKKYNLKLDLQFRCNNSIMKFDEFDNNTSDFFMRITNGGNLVDIEKAIVVLAVIKPSGKIASQFVEVKNGLIYADLKANMKDEIGTYTARAMLILEDERIVTDAISYEVEENKIFALLNDTATSTEEFILLTDMLSRLSTIEISEEQRMINESERILAEENRKIEEAKRVEAELNRQHEEADRSKYEATRESNENIRKLNEVTRQTNEDIRIQNEANRIDAEDKRIKAEQLRKDNYNFMTEDEERRRSEANAHKEAENLRVQAETNRVNEEAKRRTTEQTRVLAENTRVSNENTRKSNEIFRENNETQRVEAETQRQNRYNSFIADAEANANNFENYTNNAKVNEEERKANELDRKSQEDRRVSNEVERISNENTRKVSENARIESEKQRVDAENLRNEKIIEIQTDYDSLKKVIIDDNASANLQNQINQTNSQLEHKMNRGDKIKSSQLDTSSNSSKIGLNNLSDEVHQAMAGNSPVNPIIPDGSLTNEKYANNSVTQDKIDTNILPNYIYQYDNSPIDFTFDKANRQVIVKVPYHTYLIIGKKYINIGSINSNTTYALNYPDIERAVTTLWFDSNLNELKLVTYTNYSNISASMYLVGIINCTIENVYMNGPFTINSISRQFPIKETQIKDNAITYEQLHDQLKPTQIVASKSIRFRYNDNKVTISLPKYTFIVSGAQFTPLNPTSTGYDAREEVLSIPSISSGLCFLVYDKTLDTFCIYSYSEQASFGRKVDNIIIAYMFFVNGLNVYMNGNFIVNENPIGDLYRLSLSGSMRYSNRERILHIPKLFVTHVKNEINHTWIEPKHCGLENFDFSIPNGYDFATVYLDPYVLKNFDMNKSDNECPIKIVTAGKQVNIPDELILATSIYGNVTSRYQVDYISTPKYVTVNGKGYINFNWKEGKIEFPNQCFVQLGDGQYSAPIFDEETPSAVTITDSTDGIQWLLFNNDTKKFETKRYTGDSSENWNTNNLFVVATFWVNQKVQMLGAYKINGKLFGEEIEIPKIEEPQIDTNFSLADNKLILPNKMFFVKGEEIPIYLSSIIPNDAKTLAIKSSVIYKDGETRKIENFYDSHYLYSDNLSNTFRIGFRQYQDNKLYYKDISKVYCDPSTISNKTPKILHIGDSITNRNIAFRNEQFLKEWGITPTYVGTVNNGNNRRGEGREGWEYTNFVGISNIWGNNNSVIVPNSSDTTTTLNQNPFLKVATNEDKLNYPDWCFTYTESLREISYSNAQDKTQTFYIFDIANYLSSHNVETPDVITIALSTNDINRRTDYLDTCKLSMNIMISRIREQLPNTKIGIVPSPAWGFGNATFKSKVVQWIEECITIINNLDDDKVFIIPVWCHMNKEWGFPIGNVSDLSNINNSKVGSISDSIHLSTYGEEQYGKVMATFIANMI